MKTRVMFAQKGVPDAGPGFGLQSAASIGNLGERRKFRTFERVFSYLLNVCTRV